MTPDIEDGDIVTLKFADGTQGDTTVGRRLSPGTP